MSHVQLDCLTSEMRSVKVAVNTLLRDRQSGSCKYEDRIRTLEKIVDNCDACLRRLEKHTKSSFFADMEFRAGITKWTSHADANLRDCVKTITAALNRRVDDIESSVDTLLERRESESSSSLPRLWEMDELEVELKRQYSVQSTPVTESEFLASTVEEDECTTPPPTKKQKTKTAPSTV
jgi:hypothetical protein